MKIPITVFVLSIFLQGSSGKRNHHPVPLRQSTTPPPRHRIIGGSAAVPHYWPFIVSLQSFGGFHFCGGVLVTTKWVLTAAHCLDGLSAGSFQVVLGDHSLSTNEGTEQIRNISSLHRNPFYNIQHPDFNFYLPNDAALLELSQPAVENLHVSVAKLPSKCHDFTGQACYALGWGKTHDAEHADVLQQTTQTVLETSLCSATWGHFVYYDSLCVLDYGSTPCSGDSGGPLVCLDRSQYVVAGVSSWGDADCGFHPSIYTKISETLSWIHDIAK